MSAGRILVVDDDPQIRRVMKVTLTGQGYEVTDAMTGDAALDLLRERTFDLVLLDMNMPGSSGLETCRSIRAGSEIAIIMLTVRDSEADTVAALDAGADDYVTKPFKTPELLARMRAALRRSPFTALTAAGTLTLGALVVDFGARHVSAAGRQVRLTPKELDVLRYLASRANVVVSHREILQAVWGPDNGDDVDYLRVIVNQLRKKIEPQPGKPVHLVTEPWVGYRLIVPPQAGQPALRKS